MILPILLTDTFDIWRQKFNGLITQVNNLLPGPSIFQLQEPVNDRDILVYDATSQLFTNTAINSLVSQVLEENAADQSQLKPFYWASQRTVY